MKTSPQSSDGDKQTDPHAKKHPRSMQEASAPLPHETDQDPESQHEDNPRRVGKQAHQRHRAGTEGYRPPRRLTSISKRRRTTRTADVNSGGKTEPAGAANADGACALIRRKTSWRADPACPQMRNH